MERLQSTIENQTRDDDHHRIHELLEKVSQLQDKQLDNMKRCKEVLVNVPNTLPKVESKIYGNISHPSLSLSMKSCENLKNLTKSAFDAVETGARLHKYRKINISELEGATAQAEKLSNNVNQEVSQLKHDMYDMKHLVDNFILLMTSLNSIHSSPDNGVSVTSSEDSSILTIQREDIQASSSVLERSHDE